MKNCQIRTRLSLIAVIAGSLVVVGIVTALSMIEQTEAAVSISNSGSVSATAEGGTGGSGGGSAGSAGTAIAKILQSLGR